MLFIILPAYNEEKGLPALLENTKKACGGLPYRIIVVDDGSRDQTGTIIREYTSLSEQVEAVSHGENMGLGPALLSGFRRVLEYKHGGWTENGGPAGREGAGAPWPDVIVTLDADNTHSPELIPLLYQRIREGDDLVIASRYAPGGRQRGLSPLRRMLSRGAGIVMKCAFPLPGIRDYSCGFRAYRLGLVRKGFAAYGERLIESTDFSATVELLLKLAPLCRSWSEVPFELRYDRKQGASKMKIWATISGYVALIFRHRRFTAYGGLRERSEDWSEEWSEEWVEE
ncbi:Glycosyl transferase family 2 [Acididesulfobacillus acetoxydans]|uniref:Glycosyl transferase 2 protein n=1 Tax=Acididesulfobacillus acetoxydans TaxID=1561005 RepID=A0A8S0XY44_9FIRM|nr:glycosyltransferase family 2 protein [Acididesulfobacillus acetoxydans]CAA7602057.1 Glycosyl transferase family 2 [Acididesulfobacillus acetoxydans]CEJ08100.1 Glycosyl transferase 2 protein [Acididesulfobacillus acetoxydans]